MKYVYIDNDRIVSEIIPAFVDEFPGVPINKRYSKAFLDRCLEVGDGVEVNQGDEFLPTLNAFAPGITYYGPTETTPGSVFTPSFTASGSWSFIAPDGVTREGDTLTIPADIVGDISITFEDDTYPRTKTVNVAIRQAAESEPVDPENSPPDVLTRLDALEASNLEAQQTLTDMDLALIEAQQSITDFELSLIGGDKE